VHFDDTLGGRVLSSVVQQLEVQWQAGGRPPDVFALLQDSNNGSAAVALAALLVDQKYRWHTDSPIPVEEYLSRLHHVPFDDDARIQLALNEYRVSQNHGAASLSIDSFVRRFADIAETLRHRLSTDDTIARSGSRLERDEEQTLIEIAPPELIGRYRLGRILGRGGYGNVYLGFDDELQRSVAVKVPNNDNFEDAAAAAAFLKEARLVARLEHPHIVPVHDVGRTSDGSIYIVSRYVEGYSLREKLRDSRMSFEECTRLLIPIARALHHAHERRLVHRDVKPGNILIDQETREAYITDFGLAVSDADYFHVGVIAGTPSYMSPEQARGEGHRLDGRSDVFALGAVFYRMLTGRKAFLGGTTNEILQQVVSEDPPRPSGIDPSVPPELERICLKALSKRISDRYATAAEFARELQDWHSHGQTQARETTQTIVPHGLRSFDAQDASFYSELLPGPRSRDGVPESVQFWIERFQDADPDTTFRVGLIYGPSGCGKSSLVKAAVLPRLSGNIKSVYIEATPRETESRLLRGIRKQYPSLPRDLDLVRSLQRLRQQGDGKTLIVIDQFEQWLHANDLEAQTELIRAFGQCNGGTLQAVVMIRDDFAMAAARFMDVLEIPIVQGHNFATVDLFHEEHAVHVLGRFGQAFGKLPADASQFSESHTAFLKSAVGGLANGGQVVPVHLALFAEMVKRRIWEPATLEQLGGTAGVGVNFLEETFSSRSANPSHKKHEQAARNVLKALLPPSGSDIKGHMQSHGDLLQASGYQNREAEFNDLLRVLDGELRLITPTDPDGRHSDSGSGVWSKHYQLTHDYLVPSLRDWLNRKQQSTRRGRAELLMAQLASQWTARKQVQSLPTVTEFLLVRLLVPAEGRSSVEREMMLAAKKHYVLLGGLWLLIAAVAMIATSAIRQDANARSATAQILNADLERLPDLLQQLDIPDDRISHRLQNVLNDTNRSATMRLRASLAEVCRQPSELPFICDQLPQLNPASVLAVSKILRNRDVDTEKLLGPVLEHANEPTAVRLRAAGVLVTVDASHSRWKQHAPWLVAALVQENQLHVGAWTSLFRPIKRTLAPELELTFRNAELSESAKANAAAFLSEFAASDSAMLARLVLNAQPTQFRLLQDAVQKQAAQIRPLLIALETQTIETDAALSADEASELSTYLVTMFDNDGSLLTADFAMCPVVPFDELDTAIAQLQTRGYRPTGLRPYRSDGRLYVAATWLRDHLEFEYATNQDRASLRESHQQFHGRGLLATDMAAYRDDSGGRRFAAVWFRPATGSVVADADMYVEVEDDEHSEYWGPLNEQGFVPKANLLTLEDDRLLFSSIRWKLRTSVTYKDAWTDSPQQFADNMGNGWCLVDARIGPQDTYSGTWWNGHRFASEFRTGADLKQHMVACRDCIQQGFFPASMHVADADRQFDQPVTSVWNRPLMPNAALEQAAKRRAGATVALLMLDYPQPFRKLMNESEDPLAASLAIHLAADSRIAAELVMQELAHATTDTARYRLLLILASLPGNSLTRDHLTIAAGYLQAPHPGVRLAAQSVLRQTDRDDRQPSAVGSAPKLAGAAINRRSLAPNDHEMIVVDGPVEFRQGSPPTEPGRDPAREAQHRRHIPRSFAICTHETSVEQFLKFQPNFNYAIEYSPKDQCPVNSVTWYDAIRYCRWLSELDGIPEDQMCYPPMDQILPGMSLPQNMLERTGYRLPTESEWEYAARAGSRTSRFYGHAEALLDHYAWTVRNSDYRSQPVGRVLPNQLGLFDMLGNVMEWTQDSWRDYPIRQSEQGEDTLLDSQLTGERRATRGGAFLYEPLTARSAQRHHHAAEHRRPYLGFRIARTIRTP